MLIIRDGASSSARRPQTADGFAHRPLGGVKRGEPDI